MDGKSLKYLDLLLDASYLGALLCRVGWLVGLWQQALASYSSNISTVCQPLYHSGRQRCHWLSLYFRLKLILILSLKVSIHHPRMFAFKLSLFSSGLLFVLVNVWF